MATTHTTANVPSPPVRSGPPSIPPTAMTSNGYVLDHRPHRLGTLEAVPAHERGSRPDLRRRLEQDGYLYLRHQIDPEIVLSFRRYYFETLAAAGLTAEGTVPSDGVAARDELIDKAELRRRLFRTIVPGEAYHQLCRTPEIHDWFAWFLGGSVHLHQRKIIRHTRAHSHTNPSTRGIGAATQAHYDLVYLRQGSDRVLSMWIPLGPTPVALGGLIYLENSHRWVQELEKTADAKTPAASITADLPALAEQHDARWLYTDYDVGDVVVHTAHIVHAALDNVDPASHLRLSTDIRYQLADETIDARWQHHWHDRDGL